MGAVPPYLKDRTANRLSSTYLDTENASKDYKYPHSFEGNWVDQEYLPEILNGKSFMNQEKKGEKVC